VFCEGRIIADDTPQNVFQNEDILTRASLKRPTMLDVYDILREKGMVPELEAYPKTPAQLRAILG
jgi:cobalt/nickel transport system ATP-binding protein